MLDKNEFLACLTRKGLTQAQVAERLGMTPKTFSSRIKKGVFGSDEILQLVKILEISNPMSIFFKQ